MKKIMKALLAVMLLCGCFTVSVHAEESGETAEQVDAFYTGMQFNRFIEYMKKYGYSQGGNPYLYKQFKESGYELYIMYVANDNKMTMVVREWGTSPTDQADVLEIRYYCDTLALEWCEVRLKRGYSEMTPMYDPNFNVKTFTQNTFNEPFRYSKSDKAVSYEDGIKANNFLRKGIALLDNYMVSMALETKVLSLDELGFMGIGYLKNIRSFVNRLYTLCLDRQADRGGLVSWVMKLYKKQITAAECVRGFFMSAEMEKMNLQDSTFTERCYRVMMNRGSDPGGLKYWTERLYNGMSRTWVLKGFIDSQEFTRICESYGVDKGTIQTTEARDINYGVTSFTARCYRQVLGRKYDVPGLNSWCAKINAASNKKQAVVDMATNGFFHSPEFLKKNTTDAQYVTILYRTFLDREPDTGGFNNWLNKLSHGVSRDSVLNGFANSPEFAKLMAGYGIS